MHIGWSVNNVLTWSWLCACHKCAHFMDVRILTLLDVHFGLWCCAWHVGLELIGGHLLGFGGLRAGNAYLVKKSTFMTCAQ